MEIDSLIDEAAARHGLPPELARAVVRVESGGDPWAFRFEPGFHERHVKPDLSVKAVPPCSLDTERSGRATSWGLMQVMGDTARRLGFSGAFLSELTRPETGLEYGCRLLAKLRDSLRAKHGWRGVVAAYNAGRVRLDAGGRFVNQPYVDKVDKALGGRWPS